MKDSISCFDLTLLCVIAHVNPYVDRVLIDEEGNIAAYVQTDCDASDLWWWFCDHVRHNPTNLKIFAPTPDRSDFLLYDETRGLKKTNHPDRSERMNYES